MASLPLVDPKGFEPSTSRMRTERSPTGESFVSAEQKSGGHMTCYLVTYIKIIARQILVNNVVISALKKLVNNTMAVLSKETVLKIV